MRSGWARWLLIGLAALLPTAVSLVVNLATSLPLPGVAHNPWVVWSTLAVLTVLSVVVAVRLTEPAQPALSWRAGCGYWPARRACPPTPPRCSAARASWASFAAT